jgi:hypothetical protein
MDAGGRRIPHRGAPLVVDRYLENAVAPIESNELIQIAISG